MKNRKKKVLGLAIICFAIAAIALVGLVNEITSSYYASDGFEKLFPPKTFDLKYHNRFYYDKTSKPINC